jgi:hypothetical protein
MAADNGSIPRPSNGMLRFKEGPYLTPKVERIMLQIARGRPLTWIAQLYEVREPFVHYVARKTGFPSTALNHHGPIPHYATEAAHEAAAGIILEPETAPVVPVEAEVPHEVVEVEGDW